MVVLHKEKLEVRCEITKNGETGNFNHCSTLLSWFYVICESL